MQSASPYAGLADADRLRWAVALLTGDPRAATRLPVERVTSRPLASGDRAIRLIRQARRRRLLAASMGFGRSPAPAQQTTFGRQRLADTLERLPFHAKVAVVMTDACGIPPADVAFALGRSRRRTDRALGRARSTLAAAVALPPTHHALVGTALRGLQPVVATVHPQPSAVRNREVLLPAIDPLIHRDRRDIATCPLWRTSPSASEHDGESVRL